MKKLLIALLIVVLTIPFAPQVFAKENVKTTIHTIEFDNLTTGYISIWEQGQPNVHYNMPDQHMINFDGTLKEKDGSLYLSPMNGTMIISDEVYDLEYDIHIKPLKETEPLFYYGWWGTMTYEILAVINIGGDKGIGSIEISPNATLLEFKVIVDGRYMWGIVGKDLPTVDGETWPYN